MKKKYYKSFVLFFVIAIIFTGCSVQTNSSNKSPVSSGSDQDKIQIVSSLFPHYDFARTIAGDYAIVTLILPPGVESHSYDPTPKDVLRITQSDIFLYTSELMEPWVNNLIETIDSSKTQIVDLSVGIELLSSHEEDDSASQDSGHEEGEYDPHYWLDPNNALLMIVTIRDTLIHEMPTHADEFTENADKLILDLRSLDEAFKKTFEKTDSKTIISGGHFAFGYFAAHYGLENVSPYIGFSPDAQPTPKRIAQMIDTIEKSKAKAIFYEELINPRVSQIISEETGAEMLLLHGGHNISKDELESGIRYIEIMKGNLERLKIGLGYHE